MYVVRIGLTACTKLRSCFSALLLQMRSVSCGQTTASGRERPFMDVVRKTCRVWVHCGTGDKEVLLASSACTPAGLAHWPS